MAKSAKIASYFDIPQSPELDTVQVKLARNQNRLAAIVKQDHISEHPFTALKLPSLQSYDDLVDTSGIVTWGHNRTVGDPTGGRRRSNTIKDKFRKVFGRTTEGRGSVQGPAKLQKPPQRNNSPEPRSFPSTSRSCPVTRPHTPVTSRGSSFDDEDEDEDDDLEETDFDTFMSAARGRQRSPQAKREPINVQASPVQADLRKHSHSEGLAAQELSPVVEDQSLVQNSDIVHDLNATGLSTPGCTLSREAPSDSSGTIRPTTSHSQKTWPKLSEPEIRGRTGSEPVVSFTRDKGSLSPVASLEKPRKSSTQTATRSAMEASSIAARLAQLEQRLGELESKVRRLELNAQNSAQPQPNARGRLSSSQTSPPFIVAPPSQNKTPSERSWLSQQSSQGSLQTSFTSPTSSASHGEPDDDDASDDSPETPRTTFLLPPSSIPSRVDSRSYAERTLHSTLLMGKDGNTVTHIVEADGPPHICESSRNGSADETRLRSTSRPRPFVPHPGMAVTSSQDAAVQPGKRAYSNQADHSKPQDDTHTVSYFPGSRFSAFDTDDEVDDATRPSPQRAYSEEQLSPMATAENPYEKSLSHSHKTPKNVDQWNWRSDEGLALAM